MTKDEEDALAQRIYVEYHYDASPQKCLVAAIRAAVASERERAAKCCIDEMIDDPYGACDDYNIACSDCAAAIRRGE